MKGELAKATTELFEGLGRQVFVVIAMDLYSDLDDNDVPQVHAVFENQEKAEQYAVTIRESTYPVSARPSVVYVIPSKLYQAELFDKYVEDSGYDAVPCSECDVKGGIEVDGDYTICPHCTLRGSEMNTIKAQGTMPAICNARGEWSPV